MKPGDLCIVMGARNTPGLDGRIVELVRPHVPGNEYRSVSSRYIVRGTGGGAWVCKAPQPLPWLFRLESGGDRLEFFHERPISVRRLYPITPPTKEDEEYKELSNEH